MHNRFVAVALVLVLLFAAGCTTGVPPTSPVTSAATPPPTTTPTTTLPSTTPAAVPSISILQPPAGTYVVAVSGVDVVVQSLGFNLVDKIGQANVPGEGHIIYYFDVDAPTAAGVPALTAPGSYAISATTSWAWTNVASQVHTFSAQLVNNDNTPLDPPVVASSTVTVYAD